MCKHVVHLHGVLRGEEIHTKDGRSRYIRYTAEYTVQPVPEISSRRLVINEIDH